MEDCLDRVVELGREWVEAACQAKGLAPGSPLAAEEVAAGPLATARHLRLLINNYKSVQSLGHIPLPGPADRGPDGGTARAGHAGARAVRFDRVRGLQGQELAGAATSPKPNWKSWAAN